MAFLRQWLLGVVSCAFLVSLLDQLTPEGSVRKLARFSGGLVLILCMLRPLGTAEPRELALDLDGLSADRAALEEQYRDVSGQSLAAVIAERTGAYIEDKAHALGAEVTAEVTVREEDGAFIPDRGALRRGKRGALRAPHAGAGDRAGEAGMEGGEMKDARAGKWLEGLKKYRLAALAALLGIVLMLLPGGNAEAEPTAGSPDAEAFDRGAVQEEMENILRAIDGVGELRLMLTVDSGTKRELAQDTTAERSGSEDMKRKSETVVVGTGSGTQEVVVTNRVYPRYVGALVVCEGGGSAGVRLAVTQAVSALTALPSDKITVLQGKP